MLVQWNSNAESKHDCDYGIKFTQLSQYAPH